MSMRFFNAAERAELRPLSYARRNQIRYLDLKSKILYWIGKLRNGFQHRILGLDI